MTKIGITETILRDAQQSQIATRMPFSDFEKALEALDKTGYHSLECWGGATFDSCLRYLNEDPWERLRKIRRACPNTKLQMLFRGQNLLGYRPYSDDVIDKFVELSIKNGIDIIRVFDALNDPRNMKVAMESVKKYGGHAQGSICFTQSPVHTLEKFVELGKTLKEFGSDSICIKDMAGIMGPQEAYDLVKALKEEVKLPIQIHTHATTGLAPFTLMKAVEAGADVLDTALSSISGGTSQYATESTVYALRQVGYDVSFNDKEAKKANDNFKKVQDNALKSGLLDPYVMGTKTDALIYQVPGGMLSNLIAQLKAQNAMDKFEDALNEIPKVRADLGFPPLVTPTSQITGVQAVMNVMAGRYKMISKEVKAYVRGEYGQAPGKVSDELIKLVMKDEKPMTGRFADTLEPMFEQTKKELGSIAKSDEDVLSYIAFPQLAENFFKYRENPAAFPAAPSATSVKYTIRKA